MAKTPHLAAILYASFPGNWTTGSSELECKTSQGFEISKPFGTDSSHLNVYLCLSLCSDFHPPDNNLVSAYLKLDTSQKLRLQERNNSSFSGKFSLALIIPRERNAIDPLTSSSYNHDWCIRRRQFKPHQFLKKNEAVLHTRFCDRVPHETDPFSSPIYLSPPCFLHCLSGVVSRFKCFPAQSSRVNYVAEDVSCASRRDLMQILCCRTNRPRPLADLSPSPIALFPSCAPLFLYSPTLSRGRIVMHHVYKRSTMHLCGIPLIPLGRKYRLVCLNCGNREKSRGESQPQRSLPLRPPHPPKHLICSAG